MLLGMEEAQDREDQNDGKEEREIGKRAIGSWRAAFEHEASLNEARATVA